MRQKLLRLPWTYRLGKCQVDDTVYRKQMQALWTIYGCMHHSDFVADVFVRVSDTENVIAFITKACNSHYALLEACEKAEISLDVLISQSGHPHINSGHSHHTDTLNEAKTAIALAGKE